MLEVNPIGQLAIGNELPLRWAYDLARAHTRYKINCWLKGLLHFANELSRPPSANCVFSHKQSVDFQSKFYLWPRLFPCRNQLTSVYQFFVIGKKGKKGKKWFMNFVFRIHYGIELGINKFQWKEYNKFPFRILMELEKFWFEFGKFLFCSNSKTVIYAEQIIRK